MRGPPVVLTNTLGRPVTNVISERGAVPMTVVNTLGEPVTLVNSGGEPVTLFNANGTLWDYPFSLFANNEQGAWYDPSDFSTLFQNAAGTTPVTAVEQPVRLMLDRSRGGVGTNGALCRNLLTYSEQFDNAGWTKVNATVIANAAVAPDGTTTADKLIVNNGATNGRPQQAVTTANATVYTVSCYAKAAEWGFIRFRIAEDLAQSVWFDLTAGVVGTREAGWSSASIQSVGNGWYRCSATHTTVGTSVTYRFIPESDDNNSATGDGTSGILIWGAQLELGSTATAYQPITASWAATMPGNHATAPNDASRPVLRSRYNLLTYSEQFDNAAWQKNDGSSVTANAVVAPDGTTTADQIDLSASELSRVQQALSGQPTASYTFTVWLRVASGSVSVRFGHSADIDVITVTDTWQRFTSTKTVTSPSQPNLTIRNEAGGGAKTLYAWGAQLLTAADQSATGGAYQRIAAATDYDVSNPVFRPYLAFDGSDDSFSTSAIDFSGTDEMTVFAGVTKLSDAVSAMLVELSANAVSNAGAFNIQAPVTGGNPEYRYLGGGSTFRSVLDSTAAAPRTDVLTATQDISGDAMELRRNGVSVGTSALDQGTGNFGNYALFIGRRNNSSTPLNGRLYSLAVLGRTATAPELSAMEAWVAGKTGVTI